MPRCALDGLAGTCALVESLPLTFTAEYIGGTWENGPRKRSRAPSSSSADSGGTGLVSSTAPVTSWVSVTTPSRTTAS